MAAGCWWEHLGVEWCCPSPVQLPSFGSTDIFTQIKPGVGGHLPFLYRCTDAWEKEGDDGEAGEVKQSSWHSTAQADSCEPTRLRACTLLDSPRASLPIRPCTPPPFVFICPGLQVPPEAEQGGVGKQPGPVSTSTLGRTLTQTDPQPG